MLYLRCPVCGKVSRRENFWGASRETRQHVIEAMVDEITSGGRARIRHSWTKAPTSGRALEDMWVEVLEEVILRLRRSGRSWEARADLPSPASVTSVGLLTGSSRYTFEGTTPSALSYRS